MNIWSYFFVFFLYGSYFPYVLMIHFIGFLRGQYVVKLAEFFDTHKHRIPKNNIIFFDSEQSEEGTMEIGRNASKFGAH